MSKLISVIVPVYNAEKTIRRLAESLAKQTDEKFEVLFINDGSTDKTKEILEGICSERKNFNVITIKNGGAAVARNYGIEKAKGDYLCFADADDIVSPNYLKKMRELLEEKSADIVCTKYVRNKEGDFEEIASEADLLDGNEAVEKLLRMEIDNGPVAKLFTREIIGDVRMPSVPVAEDLSFNYQVMKSAKKVVTNDSVLYSYIETEGSLSTMRFSTERMGSLKVVREIDKKEKSFYSKARVFMEAYFICEQIVMAKGTKKFANEYKTVCDILKRERKVILKDKRATKRQKLIATLLKMGSVTTVKIMTVKRRLG